jgi:hypothetical protein
VEKHIGNLIIQLNQRLLSYGSKNYLILFSVADMDMVEKNVDHSIILYQNIIKKKCDENSNKTKHTSFANSLTKILVASRLLYLLHQMESDPDFNPRKFLFSQLNGNSKFAKLFFEKLIEEDVDINTLLEEIKTKIENLSVSVALDEAHTFEIYSAFRDNFYSTNGSLRGLLSPFKNSVNDLISLKLIDFAFYAGTSLSVAYSESIISGTRSFEIISDFSFTSSIDSLFASLKKVLNIEMNDLKGIKEDHYIGRSKLTFLPLKFISSFSNLQHKKEILQQSFEASYNTVYNDIYEKLKTAKNRSNINALLREIYFACVRKMNYFIITDEFLMVADIIDIGVVNLHKHGNIWSGVMKEPIALKLMGSGNIFPFGEIFLYLERQNFKHLYQTIFNYGNACTEKGKSFEFFLLNEFLNLKFQNTKIFDLPFVMKSLGKLSNIPSWIMNQTFNCVKVKLSQSVEEDLKILESNEKSVLLMPSNSMGPDGIMIIDDILIMIGVKCSMNVISNTTSKENLLKCEVQNFYSQRHIFPKHLEAFNRFQRLTKNISQKLIILIEYPSSSVLREPIFDESTNTVIVTLYQNNLGDLVNKCYLEPLKEIMIKKFEIIECFEELKDIQKLVQ